MLLGWPWIWTRWTAFYSLAHFSVFARSEFAYTSASDGVFRWVKIARSSAKSIILVWLENSRFKRVLYSTFQSPGPQQEPWGHPIDTFLSTMYVLAWSIATLSWSDCTNFWCSESLVSCTVYWATTPRRKPPWHPNWSFSLSSIVVIEPEQIL